jgi:hypothetical protein
MDFSSHLRFCLQCDISTKQIKYLLLHSFKNFFFLIFQLFIVHCVYIYTGEIVAEINRQKQCNEKNITVNQQSFSLSSNIDILEIPLKGYNGHIMMRSYHVDKGFLLHQYYHKQFKGEKNIKHVKIR